MCPHKYNLSKDKPDDNDIYVSINLKVHEHSEPVMVVDHRPTCPPVYNQGALGSCTSHALSCIFYHNMVRFNSSEIFHPSCMFLYYNTRLLKNSVGEDEGGSLRDALKALYVYGICPENVWEYNPICYKTRPPQTAYDFGQKHNSISYFRVPQVLSQLCQCLMDGYLFAFGLSIYSHFENDANHHQGLISLPSASDVYMGGHAACAIGFDNYRQVFIVRNSWGDEWGDHGYFYLPYAYMTNSDLVYDLWTFRNRLEITQLLVTELNAPVGDGAVFEITTVGEEAEKNHKQETTPHPDTSHHRSRSKCCILA